MRNFLCFEAIFEQNSVFHEAKKPPTLKKRRFFQRGQSFYYFESEISHENHFKTGEKFHRFIRFTLLSYYQENGMIYI